MFEILLVEDNLDYRGSLKSALSKKYVDLNIREASDERDAMTIVNTYIPDLVFMDINLNCAVNGLDLTKTITTMYSETVVVILSQHDNLEYRSAAQRNGADFFLSKSSSLESIFDYVDSIVLRNHELHELH
jgi:two-component system response regulator DegU